MEYESNLIFTYRISIRNLYRYFNGFKKFTDLENGDQVSVVYKETSDEKKRFLKGVTLVSKKPKEAAPAVEAPAVEEQQEPQGGSES